MHACGLARGCRTSSLVFHGGPCQCPFTPKSWEIRGPKSRAKCWAQPAAQQLYPGEQTLLTHQQPLHTCAGPSSVLIPSLPGCQEDPHRPCMAQRPSTKTSQCSEVLSEPTRAQRMFLFTHWWPPVRAKGMQSTELCAHCSCPARCPSLEKDAATLLLLKDTCWAWDVFSVHGYLCMGITSWDVGTGEVCGSS